MKSQYLVPYSQRLDEVVNEVYGDLKLFEEVLSINHHLLDTVHLQENDIVYLIDIAPTEKTYQEENLKALW